MIERYDAAIRRQLLMDDQSIIGRPIALVGDNARAVQANTRHLAILLLDTAIKDRASRAAAFAANLLDANIGHHLKEPVACARGCSHCCTTYVSTSLPEVFRLAQAVRGKAKTTAHINAAAVRARAMPQLQREVDRVICPILIDHACSEYTARPMVCRAVMSTSLETCVRIFTAGSAEQFQQPAGPGTLRTFLVIIMRAALVIAGLPHQNFELTHALEIALAEPAAEERWLAGEPLFAPVAIDRLDLETSPLTKIVDGLAAAVRPTI
jgi:Fe-S-cluster containining protein